VLLLRRACVAQIFYGGTNCSVKSFDYIFMLPLKNAMSLYQTVVIFMTLTNLLGLKWR
jgi:hypothetical protein